MLLSDEKFWFLDCQTTATSPAHGCIIEIGWVYTSARESETIQPDHPGSIETFLTALPAGRSFPRATTELTGIQDTELTAAESAEDVWRRFMQAAEATPEQPAQAIAHYGQFERAFFEPLHLQTFGKPELPFSLTCTYRIAKRLLSGLPSVSLSALSGHLGYPGGTELKRSRSQIAATLYIWRHLVELLYEQDIHTKSQLVLWLAAPQQKRPSTKLYLVDRDQRLSLPKSPGIYRFLSAQGKILYIGKATNLRDRVNSYFRAHKWDRSRFAELVTRVKRIEHIATGSTLEAAILENDEIKQYRPRYNTALKSTSDLLCFCNPEFENPQPAPDSEHGRGPFKSDFAWRQLAALREFLDRGNLSNDLFYTLESEGVANEGRDLFRDAHPSLFKHPLTLPALIHFGETAQYYPHGASDDKSWNAERIQKSISNKLYRAARLAALSRWMCRLSESTIRILRPGHTPLLLSIQSGQIFFDSARSEGSLQPPAGWTKPLLQRQNDFDVATYDRMSILISELRRFSSKGYDLQIRLSPRLEFQNQHLVRWLRTESQN